MRKNSTYQTDRRRYWDDVFTNGAWWDPNCVYEQQKRGDALSLIGAGPFEAAFELGCGEGHLTVELAARAERVCAADISDVALAATMSRCLHLNNVFTMNYNFLEDTLPGSYDILIASEVLFYVDDVEHLRIGISNLVSGLRIGGYFVSIHARLKVDEGDDAERDWNLPFGAYTIAKIIENSGMNIIKVMQNCKYRIDIFHNSGN